MLEINSVPVDVDVEVVNHEMTVGVSSNVDGDILSLVDL